MSPPPTFSPLPFVPLAPLDSIPSTPMSCAYTLVYCLQNLGAMMREAQQCWSSWGWLSSLSVKLFTSTLIFISWRSKKAMAFMTLKNLCCYIVCAIQYIYKFSKMLKALFIAWRHDLPVTILASFRVVLLDLCLAEKKPYWDWSLVIHHAIPLKPVHSVPPIWKAFEWMEIIKWADSSAWCIGKILNSLFPIAVSSVVEKVAGRAGSVLGGVWQACV